MSYPHHPQSCCLTPMSVVSSADQEIMDSSHETPYIKLLSVTFSTPIPIPSRVSYPTNCPNQMRLNLLTIFVNHALRLINQPFPEDQGSQSAVVVYSVRKGCRCLTTNQLLRSCIQRAALFLARLDGFVSYEEAFVSLKERELMIRSDMWIAYLTQNPTTPTQSMLRDLHLRSKERFGVSFLTVPLSLLMPSLPIVRSQKKGPRSCATIV